MPRGLRLLAAALVGLVLLPAAWVSRAAGSFVQDDRPASVERRFTTTLSDADYERLFEQPFDVPDGTRRIEVQYEVSGAEARTVVDLGLRGPAGLRGWSGGAQSRLWISALGATPGYLPGPIEAGRWAVVLGVPNIRRGRTDTVTITVRLSDRDLPPPTALTGRGPGCTSVTCTPIPRTATGGRARARAHARGPRRTGSSTPPSPRASTSWR